MATIDRSQDGLPVLATDVRFIACSTGHDGGEPCLMIELETAEGIHNLAMCRLCAQRLRDCVETAFTATPDLGKP